uniref:Uncharacterized protein n=1 Tax=uncultured marine thaumarchaeote KM3_82_C03 TaxID=1456303 RepID=A0A075HP89_9ARCH|nr:hypothetical protein [uncultured marine thaumarchaeote KM3_82_C03]
MEYKINTFLLEKHISKDIHDSHTNGSLVPVWRDWDNLLEGDIHADIKTKTVEWYKYLLNNPEAAKNFMINNTLL